MYILTALYAEAAERRRVAQDQGFMDLKGLFNDLKIRLESLFELTKDQMVCALVFALETDAEIVTRAIFAKRRTTSFINPLGQTLSPSMLILW